MAPLTPGLDLRRGALATAAAALYLAFSSGPVATQQQPQFRSRVELIKVDISVTDRQNKAVRGLTTADFTIREDGRKQQVQTFSVVDLPEPDPKAAAWTRDVAPDVRWNTDAEELRLVVVVLDDALLPQDPTMLANMKKAATNVVQRLGAQDLAALVFTRDASHSVGVTRDRGRLIAAVDTVHSWGFNLGSDLVRSAPSPLVESSIATLAALGATLDAVSERRKAVIWISSGMPAAPWSMGSQSGWPKDLYLQWVDAMDAVRKANVNVFPVDPSGFDGIMAYLAPPPKTPTGVPTRDDRGYGGRSGKMPPVSVPTTPDPDVEQATLCKRYLQALADETGGRAFLSNEFEGSAAQILNETGSFYLLGYASPSPTTILRFHKIEVSVNRPGVTIRSRSGYYTAPPDPAGRGVAAASVPIVTALSGLFPKRDILMRLSAAAFAAPGDGGGAIVMSASVTPPAAPEPGNVDVLFEAFGIDGKLAASQRSRATPSGRGRSPVFEAAVRLNVPAGRYQLRAVAGNEATGAGSVYGEVDVPDVRKTPLSWSGAILGRTDDRQSAVGPIVPITPLVLRTFAPTDDITAFARLYQGAALPVAAATIHTRILDESGELRLDRTDTIPPEGFGDQRAGNVNRVLPISRLKSGMYLLSFDATTETATAHRDVRFEVR